MPAPFLRIPPFPRARAGALCVAFDGPGLDDVACDALAGALVAARVGGAFWHPAGDPWVSGAGPVAALRAGGAEARAAVREMTAGWRARDPFTGAAMGWIEAVALLAGWRAQIEANRVVDAVFGIAGWKRETMDAMLWDGTGPVRYARPGARVRAGGQALVWAARAPAGLMARLAADGVRVGEIEDGFVRSAGLGANCVAPLSVICDLVGAHIDPSRPSTLETILATGAVPADALARAEGLRAALVAGGVGKYGAGGVAAAPARGDRRVVLVCGQVEDDRAVLLGGAGMTNRSLLAAARAMEPDAEIVWRPHPDVEAGHRKGAIPAEEVARLADRVERSAPITALFAEADVVHVISSLAGFEALLRGVSVVTHGVPFYAGWGLTRNMAPIPARRGRVVSLDELVAAALIVAPRYLDPVTRLPCGPEVVVARLAAGQAGMVTPLVRVRAAWGAFRKRVWKV